MEIPISLELMRTLVEIYAVITVLRALMQYTDADFHNPVSQIIDRLTRVPIRILRLFVPRISGADIGSPFVLAFIITAVERFLFVTLQGVSVNIFALLILTPARLLDYAITIFIAAILIRVVMSWVARRITPLTRLVLTFTEPIMRPARRILPTFGGLDFSPILVLIFLNLVDSFGVRFLEELGYQMLG